MLNDKDQVEKYLRAMHRELKLLETLRRHPPVHALIPPIQRGWKRRFVMTPPLASDQTPRRWQPSLTT